MARYTDYKIPESDAKSRSIHENLARKTCIVTVDSEAREYPLPNHFPSSLMESDFDTVLEVVGKERMLQGYVDDTIIDWRAHIKSMDAADKPLDFDWLPPVKMDAVSRTRTNVRKQIDKLRGLGYTEQEILELLKD